MQYLVLVHDNTSTQPTDDEWTEFIQVAVASGLFRGGSAVGARQQLGAEADPAACAWLTGFMRFDAEEREPLLELLERHPTVVHGGTIELCELPKT